MYHKQFYFPCWQRDTCVEFWSVPAEAGLIVDLMLYYVLIKLQYVNLNNNYYSVK